MNFLPSSSAGGASQVRRARDKVEARNKDKLNHSAAQSNMSTYSIEAQHEDEGALSSPWTAAELTSPASSDFEAISESELHPLTTSFAGDSSSRRRQPSTDDDWARPSSVDTGAGRGQHLRLRLRNSASVESARRAGRDGGEGDDEFSAVEEEGRGRGRTRDRRRPVEDPVVKRNMVEDALRSSIATLISLSGPRQTMSPATSSFALNALVNPHQPTPGSTSPHRSSYESSRQLHARPRPPPRSFTAVASETFFIEDDEDEFELEQEATQDETSQWEDAIYKSSTSETDDGAALDLSDDEGTQLGPRILIGQADSGGMEISTSSRAGRERERSLSDSLSARPSIYSPIQSRSLGNSLPTVSSSWGRRGGRRHRQPSDSPGPASIDDRRRARAGRLGRGSSQRVSSLTDDDNDAFELEHTFLELCDAASMFMSMSPRHASGSVLSGGSVNSSATARLGVASPRHSGAISPRGVVQSRSVWTPEPPASPESVPSSDPFLASSVPTLDLSSGTDEARSPATKGEAGGKAGGASGDHDEARDGGGGGWFGWLAELKLWHLVSIAGLLVGVGLNAGAIVRTSKHFLNRLSVNTAQ